MNRAYIIVWLITIVIMIIALVLPLPPIIGVAASFLPLAVVTSAYLTEGRRSFAYVRNNVNSVIWILSFVLFTMTVQDRFSTSFEQPWSFILTCAIAAIYIVGLRLLIWRFVPKEE
ncbi:hypothetical protein [Pedobacter deserti]|uniref:hypothetical protein n=1 Tax=Pedobacter deserti TaxID=2817382 RepID=UPI00210C391C|nr:hypothetical protein [Pedobacter sp. SYSU D00382]